MIFLHGLTPLSAPREAQLVLQSKLQAEEVPKMLVVFRHFPRVVSCWCVWSWTGNNVTLRVASRILDVSGEAPSCIKRGGASREATEITVLGKNAVESLRVAIPRNQPGLPKHRSTAGGSNISKASTQSGIESKLSALDFQKKGVSSFYDGHFFKWTSLSLCVFQIWRMENGRFQSGHMSPWLTGGSPTEPSKASSQCSYVKNLAGSPGEMMLALGTWVRWPSMIDIESHRNML